MTPRRSYEVVVSGHVGPAGGRHGRAADGQRPERRDHDGAVLDAAMLSGVLRTVERLGLEVVAVRSFVDGERA